MRDFSNRDVLESWFARLDAEIFLAMMPQSQKAVAAKRIAKATARVSSALVYPKLVEEVGGQARIHAPPPPIFHPEKFRAAGYMDLVRETCVQYRET